uniref:Uncharacterized protein n=1 Tax=Micrurus spixii TaxID=129469 RepID=A0A2D4MFY1_9SAUR
MCKWEGRGFRLDNTKKASQSGHRFATGARGPRLAKHCKVAPYGPISSPARCFSTWKLVIDYLASCGLVVSAFSKFARLGGKGPLTPPETELRLGFEKCPPHTQFWVSVLGCPGGGASFCVTLQVNGVWDRSRNPFLQSWWCSLLNVLPVIRKVGERKRKRRKEGKKERQTSFSPSQFSIANL